MLNQRHMPLHPVTLFQKMPHISVQILRFASSGKTALWQKQYTEPGSLENKPLERTWRKIDPEKLRTDVQAHPDDCNNARAQRFGCSSEAIWQALQKLNITRKKKELYLPRKVRRKTAGIYRQPGGNTRKETGVC